MHNALVVFFTSMMSEAQFRRFLTLHPEVTGADIWHAAEVADVGDKTDGSFLDIALGILVDVRAEEILAMEPRQITWVPVPCSNKQPTVVM